MAFEILKPKRGGPGIAGMALSIGKAQAILSRELREAWPKNCSFLKVMLDSEHKLLGLKPAMKGDEDSLTLSEIKKTGARFFGAKILNKNGVPPGRVEMRYDEEGKMFVGKYLNPGK